MIKKLKKSVIKKLLFNFFMFINDFKMFVKIMLINASFKVLFGEVGVKGVLFKSLLLKNVFILFVIIMIKS